MCGANNLEEMVMSDTKEIDVVITAINDAKTELDALQNNYRIDLEEFDEEKEVDKVQVQHIEDKIELIDDAMGDLETAIEALDKLKTLAS